MDAAILTQFSGWMNPANISGGRISSGSIGPIHIVSGGLLSGSIGSGQISNFHLASGCVIDMFPCEQAISGIIAVAWGSGDCFIVPAERGSGLRMPAVGVVAGNFASGASVPVVRRGLVTTALSGLMASGTGAAAGLYLYVGSGGLIINLSGFVPGASSGVGPNPTVTGGLSGTLCQRIGEPVSGGIDVNMGEITSGLISGLLDCY